MGRSQGVAAGRTPSGPSIFPPVAITHFNCQPLAPPFVLRAPLGKAAALAMGFLRFADVPSVQQQAVVAGFPRGWGEKFLQVPLYFMGVAVLA